MLVQLDAEKISLVTVVPQVSDEAFKMECVLENRKGSEALPLVFGRAKNNRSGVMPVKTHFREELHINRALIFFALTIC